MQKCPKCNSHDIDVGSICTPTPRGANVMYKSNYHNEYSKTIVFAHTCLDCGYIELILDPKQLKKKKSKIDKLLDHI